MDSVSRVRRSQIMSAVRSRGNRSTELALVRLFRQNRISGWRRHQKMSGRPDFVFNRERVVVFVDGCFWHGCPKHGTLPKNNRPFWRKKLTGNAFRDRVVTQALRQSGWRVVRVWEHELAKKNQPRLVAKLTKAVNQARARAS